MLIIVFDVPAESGGALTILKQYYDMASKDEINKWIFVVSTPQFKNNDNVKVLNYPWIKKSWLHRLYFDNFIAHKLVEKYNPKEVLSLQNLIIPNIKVKQILYLHQPLPFVEKKYRLTENHKFWVYQNIISKMIFESIRKADKIIVQTNWMMISAIEKTKVNKEKFIIKQPHLNIDIKKLYIPEEKKDKLFFYPASGLAYKNHEVIVKACIELKSKSINNYQVIFTLTGDENKNIRELRKLIIDENLPIIFIGPLNIEEVYEYYSKTILIFPSYIETFGLPMLEAKLHNSPILASDCAFSHEILDGYDKVNFFNPSDSLQLSELMEKN